MARAGRRRVALLATAIAAFGGFAPAAAAEDLVPLPPQPTGVAWPTERWPEGGLAPDVDRAALGRAVATAFAASGRGGPDTRALLLVRGGRIVFERYAEGFGPDSRFHSWSMAKSFTQALVGLLVGRGELSLDAPAPVPAWQGPRDPRGEITLRHLLHMSSGVDNGDVAGDAGGSDRGGNSFVADLLFGEGARDTASYASARPLLHPPGSHWAYSTGTTTIVASIVSRAAGPDVAARAGFMRAALFGPIGMRSAAFGFDAAGTHLGGSHLYATARDYARFGLLYLRDGVWEGRRLLPEGWVDFARTPAPVANNGTYGAHFWLNRTPKEDQFQLLPGGPPSVFAVTGNAGQLVLIVPTHDLLAVRLGEHQATTWSETNHYMADLVAAFPPIGSTAPGDGR
ncbi:MAG: serine hydrolase domain-containing protein [Myxococcota bacterium]